VKNSLYIFLFFFFCAGWLHPAKGEIEPVTYDSITYEKFKKDNSYNYYRVRAENESGNNRFWDRFDRWFYRNTFDLVIWGIAIIIVLLVVLYIVNPSIFYFSKKNKLLYSVDEEDIEGLHLDKLIKEALNKKEYREAIRWKYLQILKTLHEKNRISWDANKTVNEYVYEIKNQELRKNFKKLSGEFVFYRYGNGEANEERFRNFESSGNRIINQIR
jgi:hypothetical protein